MLRKIFFSISVISLILSCQSQSTSISGRVVWEGNMDKGIKDVLIEITSPEGDTLYSLTDTLGYYYKEIPPGTWKITPYKRLTGLFQGITNEDAFLIQQYLVGSYLFQNQYQLFATDLNHSQTTSSIDGAIIIQALLGNPSATSFFKMWWDFCDRNYVSGIILPYNVPNYPTSKTVLIDSQIQNIDFVGFRIGDVNSSITF